jgi:hypothetical protein
MFGCSGCCGTNGAALEDKACFTGSFTIAPPPPTCNPGWLVSSVAFLSNHSEADGRRERVLPDVLPVSAVLAVLAIELRPSLAQLLVRDRSREREVRRGPGTTAHPNTSSKHLCGTLPSITACHSAAEGRRARMRLATSSSGLKRACEGSRCSVSSSLLPSHSLRNENKTCWALVERRSMPSVSDERRDRLRGVGRQVESFHEGDAPSAALAGSASGCGARGERGGLVLWR